MISASFARLSGPIMLGTQISIAISVAARVRAIFQGA